MVNSSYSKINKSYQSLKNSIVNIEFDILSKYVKNYIS